MTMLIIGYAVEFLIQTFFLAVALWIMIKIQDLNFNYPGLIGTAALTSGVEIVLDQFIGVYFSTGIIIGVLSYCVFKLTRADQVDVAFTVFVGCALVFGMNLFLLGWLMGDLRPSRHADVVDEDIDIVAAAREPAGNQNLANPPSDVPAAGPTKETAASKKPELSKTNSAPDYGISLKSITPNANRSVVILNSGLKNYTLVVGESASMATASGIVSVRCKSVGDTWAVLEMSGQEVKLSLPAARAL